MAQRTRWTVFLDANVLFSASNKGSNLARLITLLGDSHLLMTNPYALEEARRNIALKRPKWEDQFHILESQIEVIATSLEIPKGIELAEKDHAILGSAIKGKCDFLLTGDRRDFGHLFGETIKGVQVVTPAMLAEALVKRV